MPRRRTSNRPLKRRIKLDSQGDALNEMCRTFRAVKNGELPRADGVRDVGMLKEIRVALPDNRAERGGYVPPVFNILAVPTNHFLTGEQIERNRLGLPIVGITDCEPFDLSGPIDNIIPLR
jgi:hypothetical protein